MVKTLCLKAAPPAWVLAVAIVFACALHAVAQLTLSRMVWDFQSIEQGSAPSQKIVLTNSGDQPLKIQKVELPEGCSVNPQLADKEIKPKESIEVEFTFDSKAALGKIQQYAYLSLSDSTIIPLTVKGEVYAKAQPRLRVTPPSWEFGTAPVGESRQQTFNCENVGTAELTLQKVQVYDSRFQVIRNITKDKDETGSVVLAPGQRTDFAISVTGRVPGKCEADFYIESNSAGGKFTKVSLKGHMISKTSGVVVSPDLSSFTNNTMYKVEVTRTDKLGKQESLTVERDGLGSFPRPPEPRTVPDPTDYTLTIKLARPTPPPPPKPPEEKPPAETPSPKPEAAPAEAKPPEPTTAPTPTVTPKPEESTQPKEPGKEEEKKPEEPKPGEAPSEKKEGEQPTPEPAPKPEEAKPPEGVAPPPAEPEKPEQEEKKSEKPGEEPTAPPAPEKQETEKAPGESSGKPEEGKPAETPAPSPPAEPPKSPEAK